MSSLHDMSTDKLENTVRWWWWWWGRVGGPQSHLYLLLLPFNYSGKFIRGSNYTIYPRYYEYISYESYIC
jgi:hypothetical protein